MSNLMWAQPGNDGCLNATNLCANESVSATNQDATVDACPGCSDGASTAGNFCFGLDNTVWFSFITNDLGGDVDINLSGINCIVGGGFDDELQGVIIEAGTPCDESTYTLVSNCATGSGTLNLSATGLSPNTTYYVQIDGDLNGVGVTDAATCNFTIEATGPGVEPPSQVTLNSSATNVCENDVVQFTASTPDCADETYNWFVDGALVSSGTDSIFNHVALFDASISVEVTCNDNPTCSTPYSSNTIALIVEQVDVDAGLDVVITQGQSTTLNGSGTGTLSWSPPNDLSSITSATPSASPDQTTTYLLTATSASGCQETDEVTVTVIEPIFPTNTVTPNGDGINDTWMILRIHLYPSANVSIYDRWGQRLLNDVGYQNDWGAVFLGKQLPPGTYYYVIELNTGAEDEKVDLYTGFIEVIY
ncbi:MAG: gliding motility-associated C-terminal domain-containing protein [Flavobacteriales bacterium]|nr:gliding motility-associated C-terminal domain-containing protein [Flavobacteriales bacterium]